MLERFLITGGLPSQDPGPRRSRSALGDAAGVAQAASGIAAGSGRWVKPAKSPAVVRSGNRVVTGVRDVQGRLGIEFGRRSSELLSRYAKCLDGRREAANRRIEDLLREYE